MKALISVSDKTNVVEFSRGLTNLGVELISTGGSAKVLREAGIPVTDVETFTGFAEILDGRVKTLHPNIHAGILARRDIPSHHRDLEGLGSSLIDIVVVNLYPFQDVVKDKEVSLQDAVENIDIGGVCLLRSAAKNFASVCAISSIEDYAGVVQALQDHGEIPLEMRQNCALKAFEYCHHYDFAVEKFLRSHFTGENIDTIRLRNVRSLERYAENWHQRGSVAAFQVSNEASVVNAKQLHGSAMGYNNYLDADASLAAVQEVYPIPGVAIIKHGNPCGMAVADNLINALERAWQGDTVSAYGSVIAFNKCVDLETVKVICERENAQGKKGWFVEVMVAPAFTLEALNYVKTRKSKENLRLLEVGALGVHAAVSLEVRGLVGGVLIQERDRRLYLTLTFDDLLQGRREVEESGKKHMVGLMTDCSFQNDRIGLLDFAYKTCKHIKSNAISVVREFAPGKYQILGMGAGQPNRKDSIEKLALVKAKENLSMEYHFLTAGKSTGKELEGVLQSEFAKLNRQSALRQSEQEYISEQISHYCAVGSDAFFPFVDSIEILAKEGVRYVIQPGGSIHDAEVIKAANDHQMVMIFTGMRHFRH